MYTKPYPDYSFDKAVIYMTAYGDITPVTPRSGGKPYDKLQVMLRRSSYGTKVTFTPCRRIVRDLVNCTLGPNRDESGFTITLKPDVGYDARLVRGAKRVISERVGEIAAAFDAGNDGEIADMFLGLLTEGQRGERNEWRASYGRL